MNSAPLPHPGRLRAPAGVGGVVWAILMLFPKRRHEGGESFVEPKIRPILAGGQIAEPLMAHFVEIKLSAPSRLSRARAGCSRPRAVSVVALTFSIPPSENWSTAVWSYLSQG